MKKFLLPFLLSSLFLLSACNTSTSNVNPQETTEQTTETVAEETTLDESPARISFSSVTDADSALTRLYQGNGHYVTSLQNPADISLSLRNELYNNGQKPYAVVVTCSDSRVVPEDIFMTGLGELFVVRTAGNVIGDYELESIEYAVSHLDAKLVLVLGHTDCGAVKSALANDSGDFMKNTLSEIKSAIGSETDSSKAEKLNLQNSISKVRTSEIISSAESNNSIKVVGGIYDTLSGEFITTE